jgi:hypothetical protein
MGRSAPVKTPDLLQCGHPNRFQRKKRDPGPETSIPYCYVDCTAWAAAVFFCDCTVLHQEVELCSFRFAEMQLLPAILQHVL